MSEHHDEINIDIHALDHEWERQASLVIKYSNQYADAAYLRDQAKEELSRIDAEIDLDIRTNWDNYSFDSKPTEAAIKATILNSEEHIIAVKAYNLLCRDVIVFQGAKMALDHKKSALERLTSLYLSGYWADPKIRGEAKTAYEDGNGQDAHRSQLANNTRIGGSRGRKKE